MSVSLTNHVRQLREGVGLSQGSLAESVGVSRQAINAIERGGQVPSTTLALRLAKVLGSRVEELFELPRAQSLSARVAPTPGVGSSRGSRLAVGWVGGQWAAHVLPLDSPQPADGILVSDAVASMGDVQPLDEAARLERNVLVSGCAPVLSLLAGRASSRFLDSRATWLPGTSRASLDLLADGLVHVAGVHLPAPGTPVRDVVRERFPDRRMIILNLTRWREGFVLPKGNPRGIRRSEDLLDPSIRFAGREEGAGAHRLVRDLLAEAGADRHTLSGPLAEGHVEVARFVRSGAADVGVAIEGVALAAGLDFVPLMEERFDLIVSAEVAESEPVERLLSLLGPSRFREEMARLPGYDTEVSGHVMTVDPE